MALNTVLIGQKAGEIIDPDAETGGYNLQIAWSTGWLAGNSGVRQTPYFCVPSEKLNFYTVASPIGIPLESPVDRGRQKQKGFSH